MKQKENSLLKVMLVDDEAITRRFLRDCIDWAGVGMEVISEAAGAAEALDILEEQDVDIIFTDIQMPFIDGLEFSGIVADRKPGIKIVIITAHKDFEYAKQSISVGVSDFLLKPVNKVELYNVAMRLQESIQREKDHWSDYDWLRTQLRENYDFLREKMLTELLEKSAVGELAQKLSFYCPHSQQDFIQVALLDISPADTPRIGEEGWIRLRLQIHQYAKLFFSKRDGIDIFFDNSHRIVLLSMNSDENLVEGCEQLQKGIGKNIGSCAIYLGIGNSYNTFQLAAQSYQEAKDALKYSSLSGTEITLFRADLSLEQPASRVSHINLDEIAFFVKAGLAQKAVEEAETVFMNMHFGDAINEARILSVNMLSSILNAVIELGLYYDDVLESDEVPFQSIVNCSDIDNMLRCITQTIHAVTQAINVFRKSKSKKTTDDILAYIKENYTDPQLSLAVIAKIFYVNANYLSRMFKKETGLSFTEYLTRIRMEKAMEFIRASDMKAYQVAEQIGMRDAYYFSNCFKRFTGMTVREYKKK